MAAGYIESAVNFMIVIRRMLVLGGYLCNGIRSMLMKMKDRAKQQVGALPGHKAPADEDTAL